MHIALVTQEYPPASHGGIGAQAEIKAAGLTQWGHSVTVLAHSLGDSREESSAGNLRKIRIPGYDRRLVIRNDAARWLTYSICVAEELTRLHQHQRLDLIEFAEWGGEGYAFLLNRSSDNYVPCVIQLHGPLAMFAHTMNWPPMESDLFRVGTHMEGTSVNLADAVYSSSQCSIDWCSTHYGMSEVGVPILHTGVDTELFQPRTSSRDERPTIVFVGKLVKNKGVLELAEAAGNLLGEFPDLQLFMIGGGETGVVDGLQSIRDRAPGRGFLQLLGFVSRNELPNLLNRGHVFAAPSIYEGGPGFVYLEAMSCGLPVIACSGSGASEVVSPNETGLLVPPNDVEALTAALRQLLSDAELRNAMSLRAREYALAEANSQTCLQRLVTFYESVIEGCKRGRLAC